MEHQVLELLRATTTPNTETVRNAEHGLQQLFPQIAFPFALLTIATHSDVDLSLRKASLTTLKSYIQATWSPQFDETFQGTVYLDEDAKSRIREQILAICTNDHVNQSNDNFTQALAAGVASRIASSDFPESWPSLLPTLLSILQSSNDDISVHGSLRMLLELVDSGFSEEQFFSIASDLVNALLHVATSNNRGLTVRAMALNVFRSCFETLEMVLNDHGPAVKAFLNESLTKWMPFFINTLQEQLSHSGQDQLEQLQNQWRGLIALKVQVIKTIDKLRQIFVSAIAPHVLNLFQIVWEELSRLSQTYTEFFVKGSAEGKLIDSDNMPCSLDALILEEIDFLQVMVKAPPVRKEFQKQMEALGDSKHTVGWLQELIHVLIVYSQIPNEEETLWEYDANLYLSEAISLTANYTPRAACAELVVRGLCEWLKTTPLHAMLYYQQHTAPHKDSWREQEALLFLITSVLKDIDEMDAKVPELIAQSLFQQCSTFVAHSNAFMRASAQFMVAWSYRVVDKKHAIGAGDAFSNTIKLAVGDESDMVKVTCISVMHEYIESLPQSITLPLQADIINAVAEYVNSHDLRDELEDADDIKAALIQLVRDAMLLDAAKALENSAIDLFFTLASDGAPNFQLFSLLTETFEGFVSAISDRGQDVYVRLCEKTLPSLTGAFDVANMTHESALTNLAAELVSLLAENGSDPLPNGFASAVMPKLQRILMEAVDADLVRPATLAMQHVIAKGASQFMQWQDANGKSGIEVALIIINRLLNSPEVDENAATEVGGLASSLVTKVGADAIGSHLLELLQAVAFRTATADRVQFIQSLCMVFASLSTVSPNEVVEFLSTININGQNGLDVVLTKWLENSVHFAGFDEIRQNVVALSKLFSLEDSRIKQIGVKGDLIVESTGRIKTRSQAKTNPDRYTTIPVDLKILKLLVDELSNYTGRYPGGLAGAAIAAAAQDGDEVDLDDGDDADFEDEGDWEDVATSGPFDLSSEAVKREYMTLAGEYGDVPGDMDGAPGRGSVAESRARDDGTVDYLMNWFRSEAQKPSFQAMFDALSDGEREKLRMLS